MYTHIYVGKADAERLFKEFARKSLKPGETGTVTRATLDAHFAEFGMTYLPRLAAELEVERSKELYVLKFRKYLAHLPQEFAGMEIEVVKAEIVRFNSAPTGARSGYYENPKSGFIATVERVFPTQNDQYMKPAPLYAQNITVSGPSLAAVQEFNSKLSMGAYSRFLVNAFE